MVLSSSLTSSCWDARLWFWALIWALAWELKASRKLSHCRGTGTAQGTASPHRSPRTDGHGTPKSTGWDTGAAEAACSRAPHGLPRYLCLGSKGFICSLLCLVPLLQAALQLAGHVLQHGHTAGHQSLHLLPLQGKTAPRGGQHRDDLELPRASSLIHVPRHLWHKPGRRSCFQQPPDTHRVLPAAPDPKKTHVLWLPMP